MAKIDIQFYDYYKITSIEPFTKYEDIEIGATYHIPPLIIYDRRDFIVEKKLKDGVRGKMFNSDGTCSNVMLYKSELSSRFLIKKRSINNN